MDMTGFMLSMLFGMIGMGFLMYGKKSSEIMPMGITRRAMRWSSR